MKIITGASRGIGRYLFERYLELGEVVCGTFFSTSPPSERVEYYSMVDVSSYLSVMDWIDSISFTEKIELINCAAINYNSFAHRAKTDDWGRVIEINLIGTFNVIRALLPEMRKNNYGRIINFSSIVDRMGIPGTSAYATSKAGLLGLTRVLATENASRGITINNLNIGYFDIGMGRDLAFELVSQIKERIPAGEFGNPETIYNAVNFLIDNSYINGASLDINGGLR